MRGRRQARRGVPILLLAALVSGCGGGGGTAPPTGVPSPAPPTPAPPPPTPTPPPPTGGGGGTPRPPTPPAPVTPIRFADVTVDAGIADHGISWGLAAGDIDADGWVDVFTTGHHVERAKLWHNQRDGTFADRTDLLEPLPEGDLHGAQWVDLTGDRRMELVVVSGAARGTGTEANYVYSASRGRHYDFARRFGLELAGMRSRAPIALDWNTDGLTDLLLTAAIRPDGTLNPAVYRQDAARRFEELPGTILASGADMAVLGDVDGDGRIDALVNTVPTRVLRLGPDRIEPAIPIGNVSWLRDAVIADLTGDGQNEIYLARDRTQSGYHAESPRRAEFAALPRGGVHVLRLRQTRPSKLTVGWGKSDLRDENVFIGAAGISPTTNPTTLWPLPLSTGLAPHRGGVDMGVYIGWDAGTEEWVVSTTWPTWRWLLLRIESPDEDIESLTPEGFTIEPPQPDRLLARDGNRLVDITATAGFGDAYRSQSVVAADFDNDMDLDLYVVTTAASRNQDNVLLENLGKGEFRRSSSRTHVGSGRGLGDAAAALDYDRDGRVDLFLVHGGGTVYRFLGSDAFSDDGPSQLLRNVTENRNHWLGITLRPTVSPTAAIGARIEVLAGGRRQVRDFTGGVHHRSQDHGIHFGLGPNEVVDRLDVHWPSGRTTTHFAVAADQQFVVVE